MAVSTMLQHPAGHSAELAQGLVFLPLTKHQNLRACEPGGLIPQNGQAVPVAHPVGQDENLAWTKLLQQHWK
jgi:hypothetical protein